MKRIVAYVITAVFLFGFLSCVAWELHFYGAVGGEVSGSCYLLTNGVDAILIDCGSHMSDEIEAEGELIRIEDYEMFEFDMKKVRAVIITHAHQDHVGRLPYFLMHNPEFGLRGEKVYMTRATKEIFLEASFIPACLRERLENVIDVVHYNVVFSLIEGVSAYFIDAGHIPGSAIVVLDIVDGDQVITLTFSGDVGPGDHPLLRSPLLESPFRRRTDILIIEATYGDSLRSRLEKVNELQAFYETINQCYNEKKLVVIPAFAIDRTQRVLFTLLHGIASGILPSDLKVGIGGVSSKEVTEVYRTMINDQDMRLRYFNISFAEQVVHLFFERKNFSYLRNDAGGMKNPKEYHVIITPSATGDSSDARELIEKYENDPGVLFIQVGWAPSGSKIDELAKKFGSNPNRFRSFRRAFSGHADQLGLLKFVQTFDNVRCIVITHGRNQSRSELERVLKQTGITSKIIMPAYKDVLELRSLLVRKAAEPEPKDRIPCVHAEQAWGYICRVAWVWGRVAQVRRTEDKNGREIVFINLEASYRNQTMTLFIGAEGLLKFDKNYGSGWENKLIGQMVCAFGVIDEYKEKPEIEVQDPNYLKTVGPAPGICPCQQGSSTR